jgi:hypothetical protein
MHTPEESIALCIDCGERPHADGRNRCGPCIHKARVAARDGRPRVPNVSAGPCIDCGAEKRAPGRRCCRACKNKRDRANVELARVRRREYKRRLRKRQGCRSRLYARMARAFKASIAKRERERKAATRDVMKFLYPRRYNPEYELRRKGTPQKKARKAIYYEMKAGRLIKPTACSRCGAEPPKHKLHAHHHDYSKPLEITWLCSKCHRGACGPKSFGGSPPGLQQGDDDPVQTPVTELSNRLTVSGARRDARGQSGAA